MFVYVGAGPAALAAARPFFSKTSVLKLWAACAIFGGRLTLPAGVLISEYGTAGVEMPLLFCVAMTEASLRVASPMICLRFLLRRCGGFQFGLRKGLWTACMSSLSRRAWCVFSSEAAVNGAILGKVCLSR